MMVDDIVEGIVDSIMEGIADGNEDGIVDANKDGIMKGIVDSIMDGIVGGIVDGNEGGKVDGINEYFLKSELIPAVVVEDNTGEVLMLAYMNLESLQKTLESGYTWFYSRSRAKLWHKGETSGHTQRVISVVGDCDHDTLLIRVVQVGPACHTGSRTCFYNVIK